jgi:hypothetical protein
MALRNQPYLPLYVDDFMVDEKLRECSAESTGVYIRLMCLMHKSEEYGVILLKQKDKQTENICFNFATKLAYHLPYSVAVIMGALEELVASNVLQIEGDKLLQRRMVRDNYISELRAVAGKKGGDKNLFAQANSKAKTKQNTGSEIEDVNDNDNGIIDKKKGVGKGKSNLFEKFYTAYPRHVGRSGAEKVFSKIDMKDDLFEKIMAVLEKWKKCDQWTKDNGQFIPYPATWLNGKRWEDELPGDKQISFGSIAKPEKSKWQSCPEYKGRTES